MGEFGLLRYVVVFARYYFGIHCLMSGANHFLHFSPTGAMTDPGTIQFMESITTIGIYTGIKALEFFVGLCLVTNRFVPFALIMEFPVSVTICVLGIYQGVLSHMITGAKEVLLNVLLFAGYAGYYLQILTIKADPKPIWSSR